MLDHSMSYVFPIFTSYIYTNFRKKFFQDLSTLIRPFLRLKKHTHHRGKLNKNRLLWWKPTPTTFSDQNGHKETILLKIEFEMVMGKIGISCDPCGIDEIEKNMAIGMPVDYMVAGGDASITQILNTKRTSKTREKTKKKEHDNTLRHYYLFRM